VRFSFNDKWWWNGFTHINLFWYQPYQLQLALNVIS
jgi:hypothetical protein